MALSLKGERACIEEKEEEGGGGVCSGVVVQVKVFVRIRGD